MNTFGDITAAKYGPYDNGHIVLGTSYGQILLLDSTYLHLILKIDKFVIGSVTSISIEPLNLVIVTSNLGQVKSLGLEKDTFKYTYEEIGGENY